MEQSPADSKPEPKILEHSTEKGESDLEKSTDEDSPPSLVDDGNEVSVTEILALCIPIALICFLVWLDETILATAIPKISDEFDSFSQIGWYGPAYLFGLCTCQLPFGRVYKDFPPRITYLVSLLIFEAASILQAAAPSSDAFIVGRVFAGIGGSGVLAGSLTLFSEEIPKSRLPFIMGSFSWVHILGSIAGPVIGGAITSSSLTWRWCFYLNPILSAVVIGPVIILWRKRLPQMPKHKRDEKCSAKPSQRLARIDYPGIVVFAAALTALLLALQYGGSGYSWSDRRTIACLVVAVVLLLGFMLIEWWKGDEALVPPKVIGDRIVLLASIFTATLDGAYFIVTYQLPLWFQAVQGLSARDSGYHILPLLACCVMGTMTGTTLTGKLRYYHPFMALGAVLLTIGCGVLTNLRPGSGPSTWVVSEILCGAGTGLATALPLLAVQDVLLPEEVSTGYAVVLSAGYLGSSIALAISQAVFASQLKLDLSRQLPQIDPNAILHAGATDMHDVIPSNVYLRALQIYNTALNKGWYVSIALAGVSVFLVIGFPWKRMDMKDKR